MRSPDLAEVHAVTDISDSLVVLHDGAVVFDGAPADIETVLRSHVYEVAAGLDAATLAKALTPLPGVEIQDYGSTCLIRTNTSVSASDILSLLAAHGAQPSYFRDLSRSPQQFLDRDHSWQSQ